MTQKVWVCFDDEDEILMEVSVDNCIEIQDIVEAALRKAQEIVHPNRVSVTFGGNKVQPGTSVSHYVTATSDDKPLLLHIRHKKIKVRVGEYL